MCVGRRTLPSHVAVLSLLQDAKAALDWLAAFHALWWEEVRTVFLLAGASTLYCSSTGT
jgi:hypothetical protein